MATTKLETAPDAERVESWTAPPEQYAICAPEPKVKVLYYPWPDPTEDNPDRILDVKIRLTSPIDRFDPGSPDYAAAFDWDVESMGARAQIATYVLRGTGEADDITTRRSGGVMWIVGGRHRTLYVRVANQIRAALGTPPCKLRAAPKKITDTYASTAIVISNIRHRRDPIAQGREYAKACADRSIGPKQLAKELGLPESTVRRHIALAEAGSPQAEPRVTRTRSGLKKPQTKALFDELRKADGDGFNASILLECVLTGGLSKDAPAWLVKAWKAVDRE